MMSKLNFIAVLGVRQLTKMSDWSHLFAVELPARI